MLVAIRIVWWIISFAVGAMIAGLVSFLLHVAIDAAGFGIGPVAYVIPVAAMVFGTVGVFTIAEQHFPD